MLQPVRRPPWICDEFGQASSSLTDRTALPAQSSAHDLDRLPARATLPPHPARSAPVLHASSPPSAHRQHRPIPGTDKHPPNGRCGGSPRGAAACSSERGYRKSGARPQTRSRTRAKGRSVAPGIRHPATNTPPRAGSSPRGRAAALRRGRGGLPCGGPHGGRKVGRNANHRRLPLALRPPVRSRASLHRQRRRPRRASPGARGRARRPADAGRPVGRHRLDPRPHLAGWPAAATAPSAKPPKPRRRRRNAPVYPLRSPEPTAPATPSVYPVCVRTAPSTRSK